MLQLFVAMSCHAYVLQILKTKTSNSTIAKALIFGLVTWLKTWLMLSKTYYENTTNKTS